MRPNASPTDDDDDDGGLLESSTFFGGSDDDKEQQLRANELSDEERALLTKVFLEPFYEFLASETEKAEQHYLRNIQTLEQFLIELEAQHSEREQKLAEALDAMFAHRHTVGLVDDEEDDGYRPYVVQKCHALSAAA